MEKELQHKFFNYQAQPPADAWNKINLALDEEASKPFTERLFDYKQNPSPFIWENIAVSLDEDGQRTIPLGKRFSKSVRYGMAAASLIAVAVLITLLINKNSISEDASLSTTHSSTVVPATQEPQKENQIVVAEKATNGTDDFDPPQDYSKVSPIRIKKTTPSFNRGNQIVARNVSKVEIDMPERYIIYASSSGDAFRISKKLFDLFACSDVDLKCREDIELMQQQVASPNVMAATDFSGLLDLLQSINHQ